MVKHKSSESGQAIVLLVLGIVALLGFTALAIDGSNIYTERRNSQNAADAAALAGALQKSNSQPDSIVLQAAWNSASTNHYANGQVTPSVSGPFTDFRGEYYLVTVVIHSSVQTSFSQIVYGGPLQNTVTAVARVRLSQPAMPGYAIIGMGNCVEDGGSLVGSSGGGGSGGARTYEGGVFVNSPENASNHCSIDPPSSGYGIIAGTDIATVGSYDYSGEGNLSPTPIITGINGGVPIDDPLADVPEPACTGAGTVSGSTFYPGNWNGSNLGTGTYAPGIYCIHGNVHLSGDDAMVGDGVVLYFENGGIDYTGNSYMKISAPNVSNCLPGHNPDDPMDPTSSCTYKGIAIFSARDNTSTIEVRGNGSNALIGMVYALNGTLMARGGGNDPEDAVIIGQTIVGRVDMRGGGDVKVTYNAGSTFYKRAQISLER
jgi:hypothetical protein